MHPIKNILYYNEKNYTFFNAKFDHIIMQFK